MDTEIISLESNPAGTALQGQPVEILVTVRNNGRAPINIPVQLIFPSTEKSPERRSPRVQPGETAVAAFVWRTSGYPPGLHTLRAELTEPGNVTAGLTAANLHLQLTQPLIDVIIAGISASPEGAMVGALVEIAIAVSNDSAFAVNVPITLHYPSADKQPETRRPRVDPGETAMATFEWRTKPKPRWDVHLPGAGNRGGSLAGVFRPLIAGPSGSAVSPRLSGWTARPGICRPSPAPPPCPPGTDCQWPPLSPSPR